MARAWLVGLVLSIGMGLAAPALGQSPVDKPEASSPQAIMAERFARLALDCVGREYPNKISHVMQSDADVQAPRELHPVFYGCYDWHSSVHGHWLLVRILHLYPETPLRADIVAALDKNITPEAVAGEVDYFQGEGRASYERPYGLAWFLQLMAELEEWDDPQAEKWAETLRPLEAEIVAQVEDWLPKLAYPIRIGTHNQTAFAFGLFLDYARATDNGGMAQLVAAKTHEFHDGDVDCPLGYEPSGEDFLSPCLMEADLMRRVMSPADFADWLSTFLPRIPDDGAGDWLEPGIVLDPSDGKLVHLDGVNLSRAWALEGIANALPSDDPRRAALLAAASIHAEEGIASVSDEHYAGGHWLASFATYYVTQRGLSDSVAPDRDAL